MVNLTDIKEAAERVRTIARITPLLDVTALAGRPLLLKCESMQPGGAFKIRGAYNMVARLTPEQRALGVVTYSSGNHGQAMALAARELGAPAVVVMPTTAPAIKVEGARAFGAEVIFAGTTSADRKTRAEQEASSRGLTMVPPFDHDWIIAGQGTLGLELLQQRPDVETVLVPVGGGGLLAGRGGGDQADATLGAGDRCRTRGRRGDEGFARTGSRGHARQDGERRRRLDAGPAGRPDLRARAEVCGRCDHGGG